MSGQVPDAAIECILGEIADPGAAADELVRRANRAGGVDNVTVVVVDVAAPGTPLPEAVAEPGSSPAAPGRAPGVAAAILLVLAVALLAGAILAAVVSPPPATPAPPATPLPSVSPAALPPSREVCPGRANGCPTVIGGTAHCRHRPLTVGVMTSRGYRSRYTAGTEGTSVDREVAHRDRTARRRVCAGRRFERPFGRRPGRDRPARVDPRSVRERP